jgi:hypothetical protein
MRFKANHGWVVGGRNVYLRNRRNQIACQPAKIMISLAISLGHVGFLLEIGYLMNLVVPILIATKVEEVVAGVSLSIPESSCCHRWRARWRWEDSGQLHQPWRERSGSNTESSKCEPVKDWKVRNGSDGTRHTHRRSALYAQQVIVWWFTSREKDAFLFQPPTQSGHGIEELKSLEV